MAKTKTFFGKILEAIGNTFGSVLRGAKKTFDQLLPEQQAALLHGSGVLAFITQELEKTPGEIRDGILEKFPDLDVAKLESGLFQIAKAFNLNVEANNLEDLIEKLQKYLNSFQGSLWEWIVQSAAGAFAIVLAPPGTRFAAIGQLLEVVYQKFFKKRDD